MLTQTSARPLYEQLKQTLSGKMLDGSYAFGERLPGDPSSATAT